MTKFVGLVLLAANVLTACSSKLDVPLEDPTPAQPVRAIPSPPISLKRVPELETQFAAIANDAKGEVGVAAIVIDTGEAAFLNADERFPMQSVYKLPIAMAVLEKIRRGQLSLDEKIGVTKDDMVRKGMRSPLRDKDPEGGEYAIRELIRLSLVESDGTASDVLLRIMGGPGETQAFLTQIGIFDIKVVNPEKEIGRDWNTQYRNYATPAAAIELLRWLKLSAEGSESLESEEQPWSLLLQFMADSNPGPNRLRGQLPKGTFAAHKTGTSGTQNGLTAATNDIGIIRLPNGQYIAIAVFVSDATATEKTREAVIARTAKAAWDQWSK